MTPVRIVLADDHPVVCAGVQALLASQRDFAVIGTAQRASDALRLIESLHPCVALLDVRMPDGDGIAVLERLSERQLSTRGMVLTTYDDPRELARARAAGAWAYLLKDVPKDRLFFSVRRVAAGERVLPELRARPHSPAHLQPAGGVAPSPRELEVLYALARGEANRTIAARLFISEATVKTHLQHIFEKLETHTRAGAVCEAARRGWLELGEWEGRSGDELRRAHRAGVSRSTRHRGA